MNATPPPSRNVALPVLTERLVSSETPEPAAAEGDLFEAAWARLEPRLRDQVRQRVRSELDAFATQLATQLVDGLRPVLRQALAEMLAGERRG
jgi:hypothetical protein